MSQVSPAQQLPRNALVWIMLAQLTLVLPHWQRLPPWVLALFAVTALWRYQVYAGRWSYPGFWVKAALTLAGFTGVYLHYGSLLGLEPTVALLLTAFALKLLELAGRKDAYIVLFLGYFVCVTQFLFSQEFLVVLYTLLPILLVTTALLALHEHDQHSFNPASIRRAGLMLLQAFPLMVVLFFLFPRIGPLWHVPLKSHAAQTGVSDFMKPGDISSLSQSDAVAFRVQFEGDIPPRQSLYWRGLVLSALDDGAWRTLGYRDIPPKWRRPPALDTSGPSTSYSIIMEPTQQRWLYGLRRAEPLERKIVASGDYRLFSPVELQDQYQYRVTSWTDAPLDQEISPWRRKVELELPEDDNPRTRQQASQLRQVAASDADYIESVLKMFNQQPFVYTLQPPLLRSADVMDEFLFETRRGFCEHYAYAFVVMMRAGGIPARVVAGYQGGEINPINRTVIVHQFDAHAWAEVWLPQRGWMRMDPTAAVSPDRIEWGLEQAVSEEGSFLANSPLSALRFRHVQWLNRLRLRYDALVYSWQRLVVSYDRHSQYEVLQKLLGEVSPLRFVQVIAGAWLLVMLPLAWILLGRSRRAPLTAANKQFQRLTKKLATRDLTRQPGESASTFLVRASHRLPAHAARLRQVAKLYDSLCYAPPSTETDKQLLWLTTEITALNLPQQQS